MNLQKCVSCGQEFPPESFPAAGTVNGKFYRRRKCQACYIAVKRNRRHKLQEWLELYKSSCSCEQCGESDFRVLDFHHPNGDKEFEVANMVNGFSTERILSEIKKCKCWCVKCHRIFHYEERNNRV
jgi:hypothetical protein